MWKKIQPCFIKFILLLAIAYVFYYSNNLQTEKAIARTSKINHAVSHILNIYQTYFTRYYQTHLEKIKNSDELIAYITAKKNKTLKQNRSTIFNLTNLFLRTGKLHEETEYIRFVDNSYNDEILIKNNAISKLYINHKQNHDFKESIAAPNSSFFFSRSRYDLILNLTEPIMLNGRKIGTLILGYNFKNVLKIFSQLITNDLINNIYIFDDRTKDILWSNDKENLTSELKLMTNKIPLKYTHTGILNLDNNVIATQKITGSNYKISVATFAPTVKEMIKDQTRANLITFIIVAFLFIISCIISMRQNISNKECKSCD